MRANILASSKRWLDRSQIARFGFVGFINTAVGYLVIVAALSLGAGDLPANATGYAVGLFVSYFLNSRWTFRTVSVGGTTRAVRYVAIFAIAYIANLAIVFLGRQLGYPENPLVHLVSNGVYSVTFYLGAAHFVFDDRPMACRRFLRQGWPAVFSLS